MSAGSPAVNQIITGALLMGYAVAGTFFLRFWRETRDRLFAIFGVAFWILALQRLALGLTTEVNEGAPGLYMVRLLAFGLMLYAIVDKNRAGR